MGRTQPLFLVMGLSSLASSPAVASGCHGSAADIRTVGVAPASVAGALSLLDPADLARFSKRAARVLDLDTYSCPEGSKSLPFALPYTIEAVLPDPPLLSAGQLLAEQWLPVVANGEDHGAVLLADYMLGQATTSRLWSRLREVEGFAYTVESSIRWNAADGKSLWTVTASFPPGNEEAVRSAVMDEMRRLSVNGFSDQELRNAKLGLMKYRKLWRTQTVWAFGSSARAQGLSPGADLAMREKVDAQVMKASLEQVNAATRRYWDPASVKFTFAPPLAPR